MKILFICGSMEPGCDGVGDYVRRLGIEIMKQGNQAAVIALNEKDMEPNYITGVQFSEGFNLPVMRLSANISLNKRFNYAKERINEFNAEWISLQYVPYSFHSKGMPFGLITKLRKLGRQRKWHIMFHELWIGIDQSNSWKKRTIAALQKFIIKRIISGLVPDVIHTHLPVFHTKLMRLGFKVNPLLLFSNIEPIEIIGLNNYNVFRVGFFSQAEASIAVIEFLNTLSRLVTEKGMEFELLFIGGKENKRKTIEKSFEMVENLNDIKYTGFLESDKLSAAIQSCKIGITPVPRHALGKSGSVAAFLAHRIPVAAPNIDFQYKPEEIGFFLKELSNAIITEPNLSQVESREYAVKISADKIQLKQVANTFLSDLTNSA